MNEKTLKTHSRFERVLVAVALGALVILLTTAARLAQPPIPHDLTGRQDCLACHKDGVGGAPKAPADHAGRTNEMCQLCHKPAAAAPSAPAAQPSATATSPAPAAAPTAAATEAAPATQPTAAAQPIPHDIAGHENCTLCHQQAGKPAAAPGGPPPIPHDVVGRDDCLLCHSTGQAGAPKVPADHVGRTTDTCRTCHQPGVKQTTQPAPTPAAPPPTPVPHPAAGGKNSCADCHKTLNDKLKQPVADWENSIHAQRNVGCADCHGGDPTTADPNRSMASSAGYIGAPDRKDIPALCGSCHANVDLMRQYDLPTDQLSKYRESQHGQLLAATPGDLNVATCFDCHDGHATRQVNDPGTSVYPFNVPALCARCHANAELMKPYGIPTNQYDLFKASVHGIALLKNQDTRAPSCATCHGTHGATPPGFEEVANVCGSCHAATQEYFLKSKHAAVQGGPKCVTCHGRYDVGVPSDDMFTGSGQRQCGQCHPAGSPQADAVQQMYGALHQATTTYTDAEKAIAKAASLQMIVGPEEEQLQQARTSLLTARAAQHAGQMADVTKQTDQGISISQKTKQAAEAKVSESIFRRQAMVVAVIAIALAIASLIIVKRSLEA